MRRIGRSIWLGSPQITIRLRMPKRVRNIFICCGVVFCASSRMMKASFERAAAHEGDRRDLDLARRDAALDLLGRQHVVERVVERAEIGIDLLLHVAGQEAEPLARLDRRARQDQPVDAAADQLRHRLGDGEIGLAGARRARARRSSRRGRAPPCRRPAPSSAGRSSSCACGSSPWAREVTSSWMIPSSVGWPAMPMTASTASASMSWPRRAGCRGRSARRGRAPRPRPRPRSAPGCRARRYRRRAGPRSRPGCGRTRRTTARAGAAARTRARAGRGRRRWRRLAARSRRAIRRRPALADRRRLMLFGPGGDAASPRRCSPIAASVSTWTDCSQGDLPIIWPGRRPLRSISTSVSPADLRRG